MRIADLLSAALHMTRAIWAAFGLLSTGAGIAGIVLPLVPTTPFILLAAFCFARSSPRLEHWILNHRTFGPMIVHWRRHRRIEGGSRCGRGGQRCGLG